MNGIPLETLQINKLNHSYHKKNIYFIMGGMALFDFIRRRGCCNAIVKSTLAPLFTAFESLLLYLAGVCILNPMYFRLPIRYR